MRSIWSDLRYAARGLRKQPAFAALAILALALGIGSATTMFSVIHAVLVDPYPMYAHIDRLVQVEIRDPAKPRTGGAATSRCRSSSTTRPRSIRLKT